MFGNKRGAQKGQSNGHIQQQNTYNRVFLNINGTHQIGHGQFFKKPALVNLFIIRLVQAVFSYRRDGVRGFFWIDLPLYSNTQISEVLQEKERHGFIPKSKKTAWKIALPSSFLFFSHGTNKSIQIYTSIKYKYFQIQKAIAINAPLQPLCGLCCAAKIPEEVHRGDLLIAACEEVDDAQFLAESHGEKRAIRGWKWRNWHHGMTDRKRGIFVGGWKNQLVGVGENVGIFHRPSIMTSFFECYGSGWLSIQWLGKPATFLFNNFSFKQKSPWMVFVFDKKSDLKNHLSPRKGWSLSRIRRDQWSYNIMNKGGSPIFFRKLHSWNKCLKDKK